MPKKKGEGHRYRLAGCGPYVEGEWSFFDVKAEDGKQVVGCVTKRSGGGWIATLPVFGTEDNGIRDVRVKVGTAYGRGSTPQEALEDADRRAEQGITGSDMILRQQEMI